MGWLPHSGNHTASVSRCVTCSIFLLIACLKLQVEEYTQIINYSYKYILTTHAKMTKVKNSQVKNKN